MFVCTGRPTTSSVTVWSLVIVVDSLSSGRAAGPGGQPASVEPPGGQLEGVTKKQFTQSIGFGVTNGVPALWRKCHASIKGSGACIR